MCHTSLSQMAIITYIKMCMYEFTKQMAIFVTGDTYLILKVL